MATSRRTAPTLSTMARSGVARFSIPTKSTAFVSTTETTLGYNIKLDQIWSVPVSAGVGYRWDDNPKATPSQAFAYYVLNAGLNMKISENWTWNAISARYRDAFEGGWQTPKVTTGLTYAIDHQNSIYGNVGYAWRNGLPNKINVAFGYKYGF